MQAGFDQQYNFPYKYRDDNSNAEEDEDDDDDDDLSAIQLNEELPASLPIHTNIDLPPAPPTAPSPEETARMRLQQLEESSDDEDDDTTPPPSAPAARVQTTTPAAVVATGDAVQRARRAYRKAELDNSLSTFKKLMHAHVFPYMKYVPKYDSLTTSAESETFFFFSDGYCGGDGDPALLREAVERWKRHRPKIREIVRSKRGSAVASIKEGLAGKDTIVCSFGFYH